jgi:hypothetical protein
MKPKRAEIAVEGHHGVQAYYAGGPGEPYYQPIIDCECGWSSRRCVSFAEAGAAFDEHMETVQGEAQT